MRSRKFKVRFRGSKWVSRALQGRSRSVQAVSRAFQEASGALQEVSRVFWGIPKVSREAVPGGFRGFHKLVQEY